VLAGLLLLAEQQQNESSNRNEQQGRHALLQPGMQLIVPPKA
jgi:hypothetical protein